MSNSITSVNSTLQIAILSLYDSPQKIQGFAPDSAFALQAAQIGESIVGVDGQIGHGFVFSILPLEIDLIPNSPSIKIFDDWVNAEIAAREKLTCNAIIKYPSIGKKVTLTNGALANHPVVPPAKRTLQPVHYVINFSSANVIVEDI